MIEGLEGREYEHRSGHQRHSGKARMTQHYMTKGLGQQRMYRNRPLMEREHMQERLRIHRTTDLRGEEAQMAAQQGGTLHIAAEPEYLKMRRKRAYGGLGANISVVGSFEDDLALAGLSASIDPATAVTVARTVAPRIITTKAQSRALDPSIIGSVISAWLKSIFRF